MYQRPSSKLLESYGNATGRSLLEGPCVKVCFMNSFPGEIETNAEDGANDKPRFGFTGA